MKININIFITTPPHSISKGSHEDLYGIYKILLRHHKKVQKQRFTSTLACCLTSRHEGLIIQNIMLKQRKTVIILKIVKFKFRYNLHTCC